MKPFRFPRAIALAISIAAVALALIATSPFGVAGRVKGRDGLEGVRAATSRYHDLAAAEADGYALLKDAAGLACIDQPGSGVSGPTPLA